MYEKQAIKAESSWLNTVQWKKDLIALCSLYMPAISSAAASRRLVIRCTVLSPFIIGKFLDTMVFFASFFA
ncbi:hypothetical protein NSQ62_09175 [Solibacillus sp. FSL H8-0523]|uniref:hypothetical protein n=1 Tax=Solibacillus sp. FSL H8-0523 TaxID=2954511 RepID=UPI00310146A5